MNLNNPQAFRTAAVLFADNGSDGHSMNIAKRKIIESIFLGNDNREMFVSEIVIEIEKKLFLIFSEDEISEIIKSAINKESDIFYTRTDTKTNEIKVQLTSKRLSKISTTSGVEDIIQEFKVFSNKSFNSEIILRFFYELLNTNAATFSKIINPKNKEIDDVIIEFSKFNLEERNLINDFLVWDNSIKNKAIINLVNYSIEFSCLTNNFEGAKLFKSIKGKKFFLDNNILFRLIGINGDYRKDRMIAFLKICAEHDTQFYISLITYKEFIETINYHIDNLSKQNYRQVNPKIFKTFNIESDFYEFYHAWRCSKRISNENFDLFKAFLLTEIDDIIEKFKVEKDFKEYYDESEPKIKKQIEDIASEIHKFKEKGYQTALYDAKNTFLIEYHRGANKFNLLDTKYYFISVDQKLRKWDYQRNDNQPIALMPSQWLSFILKYVPRTDDDYKSYISFLKLNISKELDVNQEDLLDTINCISQFTEDAVCQEKIANHLVANKFTSHIKNIDNKERKQEIIKENVKNAFDIVVEEQNTTHKQEMQNLSNQHELEKESIIKNMSSSFANELKQSEIIGIKTQQEVLKSKFDKAEDNKKLIEIVSKIFMWIVLFFIAILIFLFISTFFNFEDQKWEWKILIFGVYTTLFGIADRIARIKPYLDTKRLKIISKCKTVIEYDELKNKISTNEEKLKELE